MINPVKAYTMEEYIEILRRRIWYIIIPFILIFTGACAYAAFAPRLYKANTMVLVSPQRIPEAFVQATVTSKVEERLQSISQEVLSRTRLEQIIGEMKLYQKESKKLSREEVVARMQRDIKIGLPTKKEEKGFFTIEYIGRDPNIVTTVANRLASQFIEENLKLREQQAVGTTEFLATELASTKVKLDELETAVTQYKRRHMGELPEQRESNIKILEQLQNQYQRVGESLRAAQDRKLFIQKQLADMEQSSSMSGSAVNEKEGMPLLGLASNLQNGQASPLPKSRERVYYETQREFLTRTLNELRMKYTENHPDVIIIKKRLSDLETRQDVNKETEDAKGEIDTKGAIGTKDTKGTKVAKDAKDKKDAYDIKMDPRYRELNNQLAMTDIEIKRLAEGERNVLGQIEKYRERIEQTPIREQDMAALMRQHQSTKEAYQVLLKKSQDAQQAENLEKLQKGEQFRIIDPARVPEKPFSPDIPKIILIGLLAGLGGSFGLAFFREQMDRSFQDAGDVEITLEMKVLATIPKIEDKAA
jgi:polysaccharide chain length determinant protein (PEP-CTERM system associated)